MNPLNLATASSPPPVANDLLAKRKRGRPRKDETLTHQPQQGNSHQVTPTPDVNLVGKMVSGVVEGSFDAGYILNVKVKDSDIKLRGLVFMPGKVTPVTPENDVAPHVKMVAKEEIKDQTDDHDQTMKDAVTDLEIFESAARALSLAPHQSNAEEEPKEVTEEREAATTTRLVEFFPTPETTMVTAHQQNLVLPQKETVEKLKSPGEARGFDLMAEEPVGVVEKVPQELMLELGNKMIMSGDKKNGNTMETDPKTSVSKSGFIANLFEGEDKKADSAMEEEATSSVQ